MGLIRTLIELYILLLFVDVILSYLPQYRRNIWVVRIHKLANYTCAPVRRYLPNDLPFDFSPLIVVVILTILKALW
ncbi:YggT family protein [Halobacteriovorax marinus]|uniref:Membrane protein n=1 Tax=Halobacteriovorax marinus (strain ATCC BAA-682 / DSM 15412 / SJ) TaxID=862908 RepID=E1WXE8_HALMS|nr:YggT family protein [Halobacteriovorax marinus]ATH08766.1 YggT family protein [Halobacteriovorax marinus]CBW27465.1 putative membrane protein [Halobacteriovorax marinus SJ]